MSTEGIQYMSMHVSQLYLDVRDVDVEDHKLLVLLGVKRRCQHDFCLYAEVNLRLQPRQSQTTMHFKI